MFNQELTENRSPLLNISSEIEFFAGCSSDCAPILFHRHRSYDNLHVRTLLNESHGKCKFARIAAVFVYAAVLF
ncbi:unnamed protein product [Soboliphyme baturini]|uniref:Uncharacterized protein n=1 Tax=Soboliphyme baturini TaxID=241478 RepID=A0A183J4V1_9BILA|nr:unnamed protein product [Soboliphyme baturini]